MSAETSTDTHAPAPGSGARHRFDAARVAKHALLFAAIIGFWEIAGRVGYINPMIMPTPSRIAEAFYRLYVSEMVIYRHFAVTLYEGVAGFVIGTIIGVVLAAATAIYPVFGRYIAPYAVVVNVTPGIALTPMFIAWFGFGWSSKIALAALLAFFPVFVNTLSGLRNVDESAMELFTSLRASRRDRVWKLMLPDALPFVVAGMKVGLTTALIGAIVAEFASATEGLGILMQRYSYALDIPASIASLLSMTLLGLLLFLVMELVDYRVVFWRHSARLGPVTRRRARKWARRQGKTGDQHGDENANSRTHSTVASPSSGRRPAARNHGSDRVTRCLRAGDD